MKIKQQEQDILMGKRAKQNGVAFSLFALFLSLSFLAAVPVAMKLTGIDSATLWQNFYRICTSPWLLPQMHHLHSYLWAFK